MKYLFFVIISLIISVTYSQSKYDTGIVEYGVNFNEEVLDKLEVSQKEENYKVSTLNFVRKSFLNHKKIYSQDITFIKLNFRDNVYLLKPVDVMLPENLKSKFFLKSDIYYNNIKGNDFFKKFNKRGKTYIAPLKKDYDWIIKNEEKNILGFECRKAVLKIPNNNKVIAWFTPQIPIAFSPVKYYGLPGAILEVTTPLKHIYAKNIDFKDDVEVKKPTEGIKLTAEEYKEMISRPKMRK